MGTTCTCLKEYQAEDQQINIEKEEIQNKNIQHTEHIESSLFSTTSRINTLDLIKIQSLIRGRIDKLQVKQILSRTLILNPPNPIISQREPFEIKEELPNYSNPATLAAERRCGIFVYPPREDMSIKTFLKKPVHLENEAIYIGE